MSDRKDSDPSFDIGIRDKLNTETGKMEWGELERYFAKGLVIKVDESLDLIEVAATMVENDAVTVASWTQQGLVSPPQDQDVIAWLVDRPLFWVVVVAPWVVIQKIKST